MLFIDRKFVVCKFKNKIWYHAICMYLPWCVKYFKTRFCEDLFHIFYTQSAYSIDRKHIYLGMRSWDVGYSSKPDIFYNGSRWPLLQPRGGIRNITSKL